MAVVNLRFSTSCWTGHVANNKLPTAKMMMTLSGDYINYSAYGVHMAFCMDKDKNKNKKIIYV